VETVRRGIFSNETFEENQMLNMPPDWNQKIDNIDLELSWINNTLIKDTYANWKERLYKRHDDNIKKTIVLMNNLIWKNGFRITEEVEKAIWLQYRNYEAYFDDFYELEDKLHEVIPAVFERKAIISKMNGRKG
jgi:hypothetical protein